MQCNQLRELFTSDPHSQNEATLQHLAECDECAEWLTELQSFEVALSEAMQIGAPEELEQRILAQQKPPETATISQLHTRRHKWHPALALAASLLLVVGLITSLNDQQPIELFEQQMLSWLSDQQPAHYLNQQASDSEVEGMFREVGAELVGDIGTVLHCRITTVEDHKVGYFIIDSEQGLVSVLLVANGSKSIFVQSSAGTDNSKNEQRIKAAIHWI
ncbi:MAG: DUF3379 domain-containing protein [Candidatus Polarisedimenticolaceae bacterium]|nr:DUF3379 domain-containing protein [Candidatus Polarisedimenticolaceae bacterium]